MTVLMFMHGGWEVVTSAWTVAAKDRPNEAITICYPWSSSSGFGWMDNSTGVARVELAITLTDFYNLLARSGAVLDLRDLR